MEDVLQLLSEINREAKTEWNRLELLKMSIHGDLTSVYAPHDGDGEFRDLARKARTPWLSFAAECFADALIISGYSDKNAWNNAWEKSGFSGQQHAVNYEACAYGYTYILAFPSNDGGVMLKHLPTLKTFAMKADPWDAHPSIVLTRVSDELWRLFTDEAMYDIVGSPETPSDIIRTPHGLGICPVALVMAQADGLSIVEKGKTAYKRVVDNAFTALTLLRYQSFPQKWMTGGEVQLDEAGNPLMNVAADTLIHSDDPETRFGNFGNANLNETIASTDAALGQLASVLSIPAHYFHSTKLVNVSSDTIAATETSFQRKLNKLRETIGEGYETALRYASFFMGDHSAFNDYTSELTWQSTEVKSMAASADAVYKLASAGAPMQNILHLMPGLSQSDILAIAEGLKAKVDVATPVVPPIAPDKPQQI